MLGLMQDVPLLVSSLIRHADRHHGDVEIVSRRVEGDLHRTTYRELHARAQRLANALERSASACPTASRRSPGTATGTWSCTTASPARASIVHTINPRLPADQIAWITVHAEDTLLFFDLTFLPIVEKIAAQCPTITVVRRVDRSRAHAGHRARSPTCSATRTCSRPQSDHYNWPEFDENIRVVAVLHVGHDRQSEGRAVQPSLDAAPHVRGRAARCAQPVRQGRDAAGRADVPRQCMGLAVHRRDGRRQARVSRAGAGRQVAARSHGGRAGHRLRRRADRVAGLLGYMEQHGLAFTTMRRTIIGGSALPPAMLRHVRGQVRRRPRVHAWGMTEMSPLGTVCTLRALHGGLRSRGTLQSQGEAGPRDVRRRHEDRRSRWQ